MLATTAWVIGTYASIQKMFDLSVGAISYRLPPASGNLALYLPVLSGVAALMLVLLIARGWTRLGCILLFATVALDLTQFAYFGSGRTYAGDLSRVKMDATWETIKNDLVTHHGRLLPLEHNGYALSPGNPIINILNGIPSASGYGPLMQESYARATGMTLWGHLAQPPVNSALYKILDVLWIGHNKSSEQPLSIQLGNNCGPATLLGTRRIHLPTTVMATRIHVISYMGCSTGIAQNEPVVDLHLAAGSGQSETIPLLAGRDTAEWAIDRPDVSKVILHRPASIAGSFEADGFVGHKFETTLAVGDGNPVNVNDIQFDWLRKAGSIVIAQTTLIDDTTGARYIVPDFFEFATGGDWDQPITTSTRDTLQRYEKALGPAWLVDETLPMARPDIAQAIATGHLPDQSVFDPGRTALVDGPVAALPAAAAPELHGHVDVVEMQPEDWTLDVVAPKAGFLVISQLYYPGWSATVNGQQESLYRTNYAFQGVAVPAGRSRVELTFRPRSLIYGAGITLLAVLLGIWIMGRSLWYRWRTAGRRMTSA